MQVSVVILQPAGRDFAELASRFRTQTDIPAEVKVVNSQEDLLSQLADDSGHHLAIVPYEIDRGKGSGLELIPQIKAAAPNVPVVVTAGQGDVDRAARAIAAGAADFLVRGENLPQRIATLLGKLRGLFEVIDRNRRLHEANATLEEAIQSRLRIVGKSPAIKRLLDQVRRVAAVPRPVLIVGERGTGKESVARAIHMAAGPPNRPMITVNCAAFNDALLESELFGHEKGAFTGAESCAAASSSWPMAARCSSTKSPTCRRLSRTKSSVWSNTGPLPGLAARKS